MLIPFSRLDRDTVTVLTTASGHERSFSRRTNAIFTVRCRHYSIDALLQQSCRLQQYTQIDLKAATMTPLHAEQF